MSTDHITPTIPEAQLNDVTSVAVVGLGLIGASILKDIARYSPQTTRYGWSDKTGLAHARSMGLIEKTDSLAETVRLADIIIIATPMAAIGEIALEVNKYIEAIKKPKLVTEVGSVKNGTIDLFATLSSGVHQFIQTHPMGGSEKSGLNSSRAGLFYERPWVICVDDRISITPLNQRRLDWLLSTCGALRRTIDTHQHDKIVASASHFVLNLSHLLFDFVASRHSDALTIAGESFFTSTRLASDNPEMLHSINEQNRTEIQVIFEEFIQFVKDTNILEQDIAYLLDNKHARDHWVHNRRKKAK